MVVFVWVVLGVVIFGTVAFTSRRRRARIRHLVEHASPEELAMFAGKGRYQSGIDVAAGTAIESFRKGRV